MINNLYKRLKLSPPKILILGFVVIIFIGCLLLQLPIATQDGKGLSWINALFTATSATCVTGLVVVDTGTTFTVFGQMTVLALIQIGGLGFMTFATLFALLIGRKISLKERLLLQEALNVVSTQGVVRLVKTVLFFTLITEGLGAILLSIRFSFDMPLAKAIYFGVFHSISNFNNAGFDLMGGFRSLTGYVSDPVVTLVISSLIILGGIGFIVVHDFLEHKSFRRFSLHSKVVLCTTGALVLFGTMFIFLLEYSNPKTLQPLSSSGKILASLFQSVTARTAGANTVNIPDLTDSTIFLLIILMFIGASPGSTGGGIKTTTFVTLLGAAWAQMRGKEDVVFFRQRLVPTMIYKAITVALIGFTVVVIVTMLLSITETEKNFEVILFEATSAFGTVGLSMGLTPELSILGKIIISITMFIGRLGPLTIAIALTHKQTKELYRYPKGRFMIG
ncbi:TrkH family potassium uptake protein [Heyndrickxia sporothermodurans]|uniref:TrkH family potassium uptake protein n=1 Tax=Heyndrickxia vini TaxID=1476025 RepID=A0ABX7E429_9BACI|nr:MULTISPECIES: TrkH family potassium uptake protein [Heyndrickxia]MEB6549595.1 TrkH family potassium uptake protein [Heyndrickxia sporothermodurans]PTY78238.1 Trk family potassium uptake protein [Heyndrickxia sporothermodurans]QQZ10326.1 TrkH family potassium uptake protein [Heyndrickxia vini]